MRTNGSRMLAHPRFRAAYDFLELRAFGAPELIRPHIIDSFVRKVLIGQNVMDREKIWQDLAHWQRGSASQLTDRFHFLRLAQRFFVVAKFCGALLDLQFQGFEDVLQAHFALAQVDQPVPGFVLSPAPAQGGGHQADQGGGVKGPLEKCDIAQLHAQSRGGPLFWAASVSH